MEFLYRLNGFIFIKHLALSVYSINLASLFLLNLPSVLVSSIGLGAT